MGIKDPRNLEIHHLTLLVTVDFPSYKMLDLSTSLRRSVHVNDILNVPLWDGRSSLQQFDSTEVIDSCLRVSTPARKKLTIINHKPVK